MINPLAVVRDVPQRTWVRYRFVFIVLAPVMALFIYLRVVPTGQALLMSLFDWELIKPAEKFVGLDNYVNLLSDENFQPRASSTPRSSRSRRPSSRCSSRSSSPRSWRGSCTGRLGGPSSCCTSPRSSCPWSPSRSAGARSSTTSTAS